MNPKKAVETITYVYGTDIRAMSSEELLMAIREAKMEIKSLEEAGIESKYVAKEIKRLNKAIKIMIAKLDS